MRLPGSRTRRQITAQVRLRGPRVRALQRSHGLDCELIVSLTTYPARVEAAWQSIRALQRQTVKPDRIVLTLWEGDFPGRRIPPLLEGLAAAGLQILWHEANLKSYLKLVPTLARYPDAVIVTADDDTLYPVRWLSRLVTGHRAHPEAIVSARAHAMVLRTDGSLASYVDWPPANPSTPSQLQFPTGVGGVLYPPDSLANAVFDSALAFSLCPHADDVWFKACSLLKGTRCILTEGPNLDPVVVIGSQKQQLMAMNVVAGANDAQLRRTFTHFDLWDSIGAVASG